MMPSQPANLLPTPFAQDGTKAIIPPTRTLPGRASFSMGFPPETQLPLNAGGVAPNRTDFQGILYMLSTFAFWQQSGGMFSYVPTLNYTPPATVFHNGKLWWCTGPSGPETTKGAVAPGDDEECWADFFKSLAKMSGGDSSIGLPVGAYAFGRWSTAPEGFFACDGSTFDKTAYPKLFTLLGTDVLPAYNVSGVFLRALGGPSSIQGIIKTATVGPHAHTMPGRVFDRGLHHDNSMEEDVGVERYSATGSTLTTGSGMGAETAPIHAAEMLCIKHD